VNDEPLGSTRELPAKAVAGAPLLEIRDLDVSFRLERSTVYAVQGFSLQVHAGERIGVVGESGSGKSVSALSVMQMVPLPGRITGGQIVFEGQDLLRLSPSEMRGIRGGQIGMIPQNPLTSLNPVMTVESHFHEVLSLHLGMNKHQAGERTVELLRSVGIPDPATRSHEYPHRLSGGQRQRVIIALAMACQPRLLIADEPTTALDVTIQAQILELFDDLVRRSDLGAILITHNLGIVAGHCDRVVVMYAGRVMETATVMDLFDYPSHPYTVGLLACVPRLTATRSRVFAAIPGLPPQVTELSEGCPFSPRCARASDRCRTETPPLEEIAPSHWIACWNPVEAAERIAS
jgi:oligopeptide/dipeptide ABC transporter ATP-binding protein